MQAVLKTPAVVRRVAIVEAMGTIVMTAAILPAAAVKKVGGMVLVCQFLWYQWASASDQQFPNSKVSHESYECEFSSD